MRFLSKIWGVLIMTSLVLCTGKWKVHFQDFHEKNLNRTFSIDCDIRILTFSIFDEKFQIFRKLFYFQLNILISGFLVKLVTSMLVTDVGDEMCWWQLHNVVYGFVINIQSSTLTNRFQVINITMSPTSRSPKNCLLSCQFWKSYFKIAVQTSFAVFSVIFFWLLRIEISEIQNFFFWKIILKNSIKIFDI